MINDLLSRLDILQRTISCTSASVFYVEKLLINLTPVSRNETSLVNLQLLTRDKSGNDKKVEQVVYGREYTLRADITRHDGKCNY